MDQADILAEFTDVLNKYGAKSDHVDALFGRYRDDPELLKLFETAIKVQIALQPENLSGHGPCLAPDCFELACLRSDVDFAQIRAAIKPLVEQLAATAYAMGRRDEREAAAREKEAVPGRVSGLQVFE